METFRIAKITLTAVIMASQLCLAQASKPPALKPTAVDLISGYRKLLEWIGNAKTLHIKLKLTTSEVFGSRTAETEAETGFDENRSILMHHVIWPHGHDRKIVRDGNLKIEDARFPFSGNLNDARMVRSYVLALEDPPVMRIGGFDMNSSSWTVICYQQLQRSNPAKQDLHYHTYMNELFVVPPEDFVLKTNQTIKGVECFVVQTPLFQTRLYFQASDLRLHGVSFPRDPFSTPDRVKNVFTRIMTKGPQPAPNIAEFVYRYSKLDKATRAAIANACATEFKGLNDGAEERWMLDYKEIAPGCWLPMKVMTNTSPVDIGSPPGTRTEEILLATVNQPIPDSVFKIEMEEGITVHDSRFGNNITYQYSKSRTEAQLREMAAKAPPLPDSRGARPGR